MESKIMVTIPCQFSFKLKLEQMSCLSVGQKHCASVAARRPFRKSQIHQIFCKPGHGLSQKKKTRCGIACVPGDWEDATLFVLVVSFLISMVQLVQEDPTHIPYTARRWTLYFDEHGHAKCRPSLKYQSKRWSFWSERACTCSAVSA